MLSALSFVLVHELAAAITSLTGRVLLLATYLGTSPFQQVADFRCNLPNQPGTERVKVAKPKGFHCLIVNSEL